MYDLIPPALGILMTAPGFFMALNPQDCLKKELRNNKRLVSLVKTIGVALAVCGIVVMFVGVREITMGPR